MTSCRRQSSERTAGWRHLLAAAFLLVAARGIAAADPPVAAPLKWSLRDELQTGSQRQNPNFDRDDQPVWHFLRTTASEGPVAARRWLRDGKYVPLAEHSDKLFDAPLDGWAFRCQGERLAPLVGKVTADYDVGLRLKPGDLMIAPGPEHAVVIGWRSPVAGRLDIEGVFEHAQNCCGVNSQIAWYVERGPAPDPANGFQPALLASGTSDFGSPSQLGKFRIADQPIAPGQFIYFCVDAVADGTDTPHHGDGTRLDVVLTVRNATPPPAPTFAKDVLPILAAHCHDCHGADQQQGQLDLRSVSRILQGGESGPAIVLGDPAGSLLVDLVTRGQMPPENDNPLTTDETAILRRWIRARAPAAEAVVALPPRSQVTADDRQFWAFQPPRSHDLPRVAAAERVRTAIDAFLLAKLEARGLSFSPAANRAALARRLHFDLVGLPPSPEDTNEFLADDSPDAYDRLVDRLLASPAYGQRWGRHWLDAAGYVDNRLFDGDLATIYPNDGIWRYRDYVVGAWNQDKPYDRFLLEQLAGDELVDWRRAKQFHPELQSLLAATGYLRCVEDHTSEPQYGLDKRYEVINEIIEMLSTSVLGLTMECCRCHNHKYDPLPQRDYYRLMACFEPALNVNAWQRPQERFLADVALPERTAIDAHNAALDKQIAELQPQVKSAEDAKDTARSSELKQQIAQLQAQRKSYGKIQALWDVGPPPASRVFRRGNVHAPGVLVQAGFPEILQPAGESTVAHTADAAGETSGRRLALARWLAQPNHPLTSRVIVNRVWHHHFGRGIVETLGNLGRSGSAPTHPELLDWLAVDFVAHDWSLKRLHRQLLLSEAFRQSSRRPTESPPPTDASAAGERLDPENRLLWRMPLRRLESEIVRDAILATSGALDRSAGGPPVEITTPTDGLSEPKAATTSAAAHRRSLYLFARRVYPLKFLEIFDSPIMAVNCTQRLQSATVLQSLALLNGEFMFEQSDRMADRILAAAGADPESQVRLAIHLAFARQATDDERQVGGTFLVDQARQYAADPLQANQAGRCALAELCHMLLSANEFLYVE